MDVIARFVKANFQICYTSITSVVVANIIGCLYRISDFIEHYTIDLKGHIILGDRSLIFDAYGIFL
jgi:hypothetical protein